MKVEIESSIQETENAIGPLGLKLHFLKVPWDFHASINFLSMFDKLFFSFQLVRVVSQVLMVKKNLRIDQQDDTCVSKAC